MKYNYREAMISDILEYIENEINVLDFDSREDLAETLNDNLWVYDGVTGNASGSYTFNRQQAKEYVIENLDDLHTACEDFCVDAATVGEKFLNEEWEYFDATGMETVIGGGRRLAFDATGLEPEKEKAFGHVCQKAARKFGLTECVKTCIINFVRKNVGAWCNGNTWVSKTFVEGSSPSAPAISRFRKESAVFYCLSGTRAEYISSNPSPYK